MMPKLPFAGDPDLGENHRSNIKNIDYSQRQNLKLKHIAIPVDKSRKSSTFRKVLTNGEGVTYSSLVNLET